MDQNAKDDLTDAIMTLFQIEKTGYDVIQLFEEDQFSAFKIIVELKRNQHLQLSRSEPVSDPEFENAYQCVKSYIKRVENNEIAHGPNQIDGEYLDLYIKSYEYLHQLEQESDKTQKLESSEQHKAILNERKLQLRAKKIYKELLGLDRRIGVVTQTDTFSQKLLDIIINKLKEHLSNGNINLFNASKKVKNNNYIIGAVNALRLFKQASLRPDEIMDIYTQCNCSIHNIENILHGLVDFKKILHQFATLSRQDPSTQALTNQIRIEYLNNRNNALVRHKLATLEKSLIELQAHPKIPANSSWAKKFGASDNTTLSTDETSTTIADRYVQFSVLLEKLYRSVVHDKNAAVPDDLWKRDGISRAQEGYALNKAQPMNVNNNLLNLQLKNVIERHLSYSKLIKEFIEAHLRADECAEFLKSYMDGEKIGDLVERYIAGDIDDKIIKEFLNSAIERYHSIPSLMKSALNNGMTDEAYNEFADKNKGLFTKVRNGNEVKSYVNGDIDCDTFNENIKGNMSAEILRIKALTFIPDPEHGASKVSVLRNL